MILDIMIELKKFLSTVETWFYENYNNPLLWLGLVIVIAAFMGAGFASLHKGE